jgi:hypothetical protein
MASHTVYLMMSFVADTCCQIFNFADLIHVVSLTVINCYTETVRLLGL